MRKLLLAAFILIFALSFAAAYAYEDADRESGFSEEDIDYAKTPVNKFGRGVINTATCWTEIPGKVAEVSGETNPAIGFTLGAVEGTITGLVRGVTGIFDTLTCIFPPYDEPVMQPEYAMEGADAKMQEYFW